MNRTNNKITRIGVLYLIANIFEKAIAFLLLPVFTNLLSTENYGIVSTYNSYVNIVAVFICLSLGNSLRGAIRDYAKELSKYVSSILFLESIIASLFSAIVIIIGIHIIPHQYIIMVYLCPIQSYIQCIISTLSLQYMLESRYIRRTILCVAPPLISIFASIFLIKNMESSLYLGKIIGTFIVYAVFGLICFVLIFMRGRLLYRKDYWIYSLKFSIPLVFHGFSLIILNQMDRVMLTSMYDAAETGIYSVAYSFGSILIAFNTAMNDVWVPWYYKKMNQFDKKAIDSVARIYTWTSVLLSCGIMLLSPEVMKLFTNSSYWDGISAVPVLVFGIYFSAISALPINAMYYSKKTKMIALSSIIAMLTNLMLNFILIPVWGIYGASLATLFSYIVLFLMQEVSVNRKYNKLFTWKNVYLPQFIAMLCIVVVTYFSLDCIIVRWTVCLIILLIYVYFAIRKWNILGYILK